jgi:hypothetical protein
MRKYICVSVKRFSELNSTLTRAAAINTEETHSSEKINMIEIQKQTNRRRRVIHRQTKRLKINTKTWIMSLMKA